MFKGPEGKLLAVVTTMVWHAGDWKYLFPPAGGSRDAGDRRPDGLCAVEQLLMRSTSAGAAVRVAAGRAAAAADGRAGGGAVRVRDQPAVHHRQGRGGAVSSVAGDAITALAKSVLGALGHAVEWASTLWVGIGTPPVADGAGRRPGRSRFCSRTCWCSRPALAVLCTLLGAGRIVYHEHKAAQLRELGRYLATYVLVSGAAAGAASVLIGGC